MLIFLTDLSHFCCHCHFTLSTSKTFLNPRLILWTVYDPRWRHGSCTQWPLQIQNGAINVFSRTFQSTWTPDTAVFMCTTTRCYFSPVIMQHPTCMMTFWRSFVTSAYYEDQGSIPQNHLMLVTRRIDGKSDASGSGGAKSGREFVLG